MTSLCGCSIQRGALSKAAPRVLVAAAGRRSHFHCLLMSLRGSTWSQRLTGMSPRHQNAWFCGDGFLPQARSKPSFRKHPAQFGPAPTPAKATTWGRLKLVYHPRASFTRSAASPSFNPNRLQPSFAVLRAFRRSSPQDAAPGCPLNPGNSIPGPGRTSPTCKRRGPSGPFRRGRGFASHAG